MKRGDVISIARSGDHGKPRPAVIVQTDQLAADVSDTVLVCQITSHLQAVSIRRVTVIPTADNGLLKPSQIMVEKMFAMKREKCGAVMGAIDEATMDALDDALMFAVGLMG